MHVDAFRAPGTDFKQYRTYRWATDDRPVSGDPRLDNNRFFIDRLRIDVDKGLSARSFKISFTRADLTLRVHANVSPKVDEPLTDPIDGHCVDCEPFVYQAGTITIDFVDARTKGLVWRGWAESSIDGVIDNQKWLEEKVDDAVTKIVAKLPSRL